MARPPRTALAAFACLALAIACCASPPQKAGSGGGSPETLERAYKTQAVVMGMADDYIAALGEAVYVIGRDDVKDARARTMMQSFMRNGVGAAVDIGASPNPSVAILDLLVLASLETWTFETHWMPLGIGPGGADALVRVKRGEADMWHTAREVLTDEQLATVRKLVDEWISEHPDRMVVSLVRFNDFADERKLNTLALRAEAGGLLKEVTQATAALDDARLVAERALWFAGRYPYVLGQQAELTAFRLADQPEVRELLESLRAMREVSASATARLETLKTDVQAERQAIFDQIAQERRETIAQSQAALHSAIEESIADATDRLANQRQMAIDQLFRGLGDQRTLLLDDLTARRADLHDVMGTLRETVVASESLAKELTATARAVDTVVARFDTGAAPGQEHLKLSDVRDTAAEARRTVEQLAQLLDRTNELVTSGAWDQRMGAVTAPASAVVDRLFYRGVALVAMLVVGLGLVRLVPSRTARATSPAPAPGDSVDRVR
jgi:hypothetical protein